MLITDLHLARKWRNEWSYAPTSPVCLDGTFLFFNFYRLCTPRYSKYFFQFKCSDWNLGCISCLISFIKMKEIKEWANGTIEGNGIWKSEGVVRHFKTAQYIYIYIYIYIYTYFGLYVCCVNMITFFSAQVSLLPIGLIDSISVNN